VVMGFLRSGGSVDLAVPDRAGRQLRAGAQGGHSPGNLLHGPRFAGTGRQCETTGSAPINNRTAWMPWNLGVSPVCVPGAMVGERAARSVESQSTDELVMVAPGSGYLATHLVRQLLERGTAVNATVRDLTDTAKVAPLRAL